MLRTAGHIYWGLDRAGKRLNKGWKEVNKDRMGLKSDVEIQDTAG